MANKRFVFYDENTEDMWCFDIISGNENLSDLDLDYMIDDLIDDSHDFDGEDIESTYGVHDVAFDTNTDILGFSSYEVEKGKFIELMEKWRTIFRRRGYVVGYVYKK